MKLVELVPPVQHPLWELCPQMGITDVVINVNPSLSGFVDPWKFSTLSQIVGTLKEAGLTVVAIEGDPFDMAPVKEFGYGARDKRPNSEVFNARETAFAHYRELIQSMARLGIHLLCYDFMVGVGQARSGVRPGRGGAKAAYFSIEEEATDLPQVLTRNQVWANYKSFLEAVMPTAGKCGVRMALLPDDPCVPALGGCARIFGTVDDFNRAYVLYPSKSNAVAFCQSNFKMMGADVAETARRFGDRIACVQIGDIQGDGNDFTELFLDENGNDPLAMLRLYRELKLDVPVRCSGVPEMARESSLATEGAPEGYPVLGRLFADGYLKALLKAAL